MENFKGLFYKGYNRSGFYFSDVVAYSNNHSSGHYIANDILVANSSEIAPPTNRAPVISYTVCHVKNFINS